MHVQKYIEILYISEWTFYISESAHHRSGRQSVLALVLRTMQRSTLPSSRKNCESFTEPRSLGNLLDRIGTEDQGAKLVDFAPFQG